MRFTTAFLTITVAAFVLLFSQFCSLNVVHGKPILFVTTDSEVIQFHAIPPKVVRERER